jgi:hypothetical protein
VRWRQEGLEFKASLGYPGSLRTKKFFFTLIISLFLTLFCKLGHPNILTRNDDSRVSYPVFVFKAMAW